eukprot:CAMPEP_0117562842 /NCGR_PEP_ID=MMETSP0784-20121206/55178_1 /TAXON_ID=39447 /ORGANISM="" /LENGTH=64 /DNA_ID=CAMNT_0005360451 /DNA_START=98 /DNA_END=288 /DNA_ORIENTATION=-
MAMATVVHSFDVVNTRSSIWGLASALLPRNCFAAKEGVVARSGYDDAIVGKESPTAVAAGVELG